MLYGKKLRPGATIGFIGPSGAVRTDGTIDRAVAETRRMGFNVRLGESCGQVHALRAAAGRPSVKKQALYHNFP